MLPKTEAGTKFIAAILGGADTISGAAELIDAIGASVSISGGSTGRPTRRNAGRYRIRTSLPPSNPDSTDDSGVPLTLWLSMIAPVGSGFRSFFGVASDEAPS